jgi:hypothetical protein
MSSSERQIKYRIDAMASAVDITAIPERRYDSYQLVELL